MSKQKKAKKARRPNIPMALVGPSVGAGGGLETLPGRSSESAQVAFDYTHIKKDLTRIGILAGSFIAILVILSFFIR